MTLGTAVLAKTCAPCRSIYFAMVDGHLQQQGFDPEVIKLSGKLVDATIELHRHVMNNFLPSAVKFHYQFNLRELSSITQVGCTEHCVRRGQICPSGCMIACDQSLSG